MLKVKSRKSLAPKKENLERYLKAIAASRNRKQKRRKSRVKIKNKMAN
jgi:hypothetical protein